MAAAVPFIPAAIGAVGSLLGKKKTAVQGKPYQANPAYTKPLTDFGNAVLPMAQQGLGQSMGYFSNVLTNPEQATASDAASIARQTQQLTDRAARTMPRGGAQASIVGALPQQQMAAGLERRINAQQGAATSLGQLAHGAGGLGANVFGNLLGNDVQGYGASTSRGYLDLAQMNANRDYYGGIGGSIYDILTGTPGQGKGSIMDTIMGKIVGGNKLPTTFKNTGIMNPSARYPMDERFPIAGFPEGGSSTQLPFGF